jgi:hypothetical protein
MGSNGGGLKYLEHKNIDYKKWDRCIYNASNSRIYAMSWHLDRTAEKWDALVLGNYEVVMPLPHRTKWGIKYIFQPLFSQQLGIFPNPPDIISKQFYIEIRRRFRFADTQINSRNNHVEQPEEIKFSGRENYLINLSENYQKIAAGYSQNTARNIKKAQKNSLSFVAGIRIEDYLDFKRNNLPTKLPADALKKLKSIIALGQYKGIGEIYGVYTNENELCAAVYFCRWKERVIYMNAATSLNGKELGGMFFLLDQFIRENAGSNLLLDLEGSTIPGVARFYKGFGAIPETYHQLKFNRLPLPLKWMKRK